MGFQETAVFDELRVDSSVGAYQREAGGGILSSNTEDLFQSIVGVGVGENINLNIAGG